MARPREFNVDDALTDAMSVFWQHGYDAASLPQLLQEMGMTRGSLYNAFTDKKSLFLRVLTRYEIEAVQPAVELLTTGPADGLERIGMLFNSIVEAARDGDWRGCLLCSAAAGPAAVDQEISDLVHAQLNKMKEAFEAALGQSGAFANADDSQRAKWASLLLSHYVGLRILVRSKASIDVIEDSTRALLGAISTDAVSSPGG